MGRTVGNERVEQLAETWASIDALATGFTDDDWKQPTGCPGWSVQDCVAHLVDYEARALGRPAPDHVPIDVSHTKNAMGESNEVGVDHRRARSGHEVLSELREVVTERLAQLRALTEEDFARETVTPAGPGTLVDMLTLRVMDTWSHEQDIRRALGRPGHAVGPAAEASVNYFARVFPLLVGKRAAAPDGSTVVFDVEGVGRYPIAVAAGRAAPVEALDGPATVEITLSAPTLAALVGGRSDAPDDAVVSGDAALGAAVLAALPFLP